MNNFLIFVIVDKAKIRFKIPEKRIAGRHKKSNHLFEKRLLHTLWL